MSIPSAISRGELLREFCARREPVTIIGDEETHWGSFLHFDVDLTLELLPGADPSFVTSSVHAVCFGQPPGSSVLLGTVKHYDENQGRLLLTSLSPITRLERRLSQRIPVPINCGLVARIVQGEEQWTPRPVDLSMSGLGIEFAPDATPKLAMGTSVNVTLRFGDHATELPARVAREDKGSYGLCFIPPIPHPLQRIYRLLERGAPNHTDR